MEKTGRNKCYKVKATDDVVPPPGLVEYSELEVRVNCTERVFTSSVNDPCGKFVYSGVVRCIESDSRTKSEFIIPYVNPNTEYFPLKSDKVIGHFSPCEYVEYMEPNPQCRLQCNQGRPPNSYSEK